jgi:hypothetical protein
MRLSIKKISASDYDQHNKRTFYVDVEYTFKFMFESAKVYKTLEFYDEENLDFPKNDLDHLKQFVYPLIDEKTINIKQDILNEILDQCNESYNQQTNGQ